MPLPVIQYSIIQFSMKPNIICYGINMNKQTKFDYNKIINNIWKSISIYKSIPNLLFQLLYLAAMGKFSLRQIFLFFPEKRLKYFMQISLHKMSKPTFWRQKKKNIAKCCLLKILPCMLSVKLSIGQWTHRSGPDQMPQNLRQSLYRTIFFFFFFVPEN